MRSTVPHRSRFAYPTAALVLGLALIPMLPSGSRSESTPWNPTIRSIMAGSLEESFRGAAIDLDGNFYVTGGSASSNFQTTAGAYQEEMNPGANGAGAGAHDIVVVKYSPEGELLWSTYVGGPGYDRAYAIEVDETGVYVGGRAGIGFPTTSGVLQAGFAGDASPNSAYGPQDGVVFKLSLDGSSLIWSTYFGDGGKSFLRDMAIDRFGQVVLGLTAVNAANPHITAGAYMTSRPAGLSSVIAVIEPDASEVVWASYLGGSGEDLENCSVRVNADGEVFVSGTTTSFDFPTTPGAFQNQFNGGSFDLTLSGFSADGSALLFSTYLGGNGNDATETHSLALAPDDSLYVGALSTSSDFPTTQGAFQQSSNQKARDGIVTHFAKDGTLLESTVLGGARNDFIEGIGVDSAGRVMVAGGTFSDDFPLSSAPFQSARAGEADLFVAILTPDLSTLLYGSLLGGDEFDSGRSVSVARDGTLLVGGMTLGGVPTTDGTTYSGTGSDVNARDALLAVFVPEPATSQLQTVTLLLLVAIWLGRSRQRARGPRPT